MATDAEIYEVLDLLSMYGVERTVEMTGKSIEELGEMAYPINEMINSLQGEKEEGVNTSEVMDMNSPDFQVAGINPEFEGEGITSELLPGDSAVADVITMLADKAGVPPEAAMIAAGIAGKNPKKVKKGVDGMFTPKMTKKNLPDKRGAKSAEVVGDAKIGGPGVPVGKPTRGGLPVPAKAKQVPAKVNKSVDAKVGLTGRNVEKAVAGTLTGALIANRGLNGDRDADGSLKPIGKSFEGGATFEGYPEEEAEDTGNKFGYHKQEGQNFWTVNNDDPYWDTHEMGTGDAWTEADAKKEVKELDLSAFSHWFN